MYEFLGRFNRPDLFIKEFNYWILMVRPAPVTIGNCIILLKRKCFSLGEVTEEEILEFPTVCRFFEEKCKLLYGAVKFNYHANMMKENFVHFKAIPRYDKTVTRHGIKWTDKEFPLTENLKKQEVRVSEKVLQDIKNDFLNLDENKK